MTAALADAQKYGPQTDAFAKEVAARFNGYVTDINGAQGDCPPVFPYDLLAVLLADSQDTEEMAMSFMVGGQKSGFDRNTFITAFTQSGIPAAVADKMIERMKGYLPKWEKLIDQSFLPNKMKSDYHLLLSKRMELL